ncbi:gamma-glutamyl-gamma-aminobutyrate hydrolase family protein [Aestuariispira insulae]|uniref:gamma-glutamyl-gamma-aminobutyrate hydrolase n=1 Tax=Aestuariispira insulae TaxID=1461337 RepID=A0A3D9HP92_9PROT|nr:gamma-glutamyl-gamma-aminobutyrate hydrolase family protein [Aestuariispira insulae]RED51324.1 gamma-glutamyl-gamma-aminobutyrate hydrolase [Aestuariispira insulae]
MDGDRQPLIGVTGNSQATDNAMAYSVGDKYILSVIEAANALAVMIPPVSDRQDADALVSRLDGIVFTGAPANLDPALYGQPAEIDQDEWDPARDATNLPLIHAAIRATLPIFCICRGHQELNVALGGSLHQKVQDLPGKLDHRSDKTLPPPDRYRPRHRIKIAQEGRLEAITGYSGEHQVNSLHQQAIDQLADRLAVEAVSEDGLIEAVSLREAGFFNISVQWHPEHPDALSDPFNKRLFESFGKAAYRHSQSK